MSQATGKVVGVNGNMITVEFDGAVSQNEVGYARLGELSLMSEVVRIRGSRADMQVFEDTSNLAVGDPVEFSGDLLTAELGPGLLTQIYDGLQNPLPQLAAQFGFFLQRGKYLRALPRDTAWAFTPSVKPGARVSAGEALGTVPEGIFDHRIMVPFRVSGVCTVEKIAPAGSYKVEDTIATLKDPHGNAFEVSMLQRWPVKVPIQAYRERCAPRTLW